MTDVQPVRLTLHAPAGVGVGLCWWHVQLSAWATISWVVPVSWS